MAMTEMFNRQATTLNGIFTADKAVVDFGGGMLGLLVQGLNFTYAQQITRLYEVGSELGKTNIYYVGGRTNGQAGVNRVVGPKAGIVELYKKYGNVCEAKENHLKFTLEQADCATTSDLGTEKLSFKLKYCVLTQVGISVQAQDMIINEHSQIMFSGLEYDDAGAGAGAGAVAV